MSIQYDILATTNAVLLSMLLVIALSILLSRNLIVNAVMMCTFSLIMAMVYLIIGAPDVAITEASVGSCISTVFTLLALTYIKHKKAAASNNKLSLLAAIVLFSSLIYAITDFPKFGHYNSLINSHLSNFYIEQSSKSLHIPNLVTTILADFRAYDTLCETIVIFTSSLGISLLLTSKKRVEHD